MVSWFWVGIMERWPYIIILNIQVISGLIVLFDGFFRFTTLRILLRYLFPQHFSVLEVHFKIVILLMYIWLLFKILINSARIDYLLLFLLNGIEQRLLFLIYESWLLRQILALKEIVWISLNYANHKICFFYIQLLYNLFNKSPETGFGRVTLNKGSISIYLFALKRAVSLPLQALLATPLLTSHYSIILALFAAYSNITIL